MIYLIIIISEHNYDFLNNKKIEKKNISVLHKLKIF